MNLLDFLKSKQRIENFLQLEKPEEYDFTNEKAPLNYVLEADKVKKFFIYQMYQKEKKVFKSIPYKYGINFTNYIVDNYFGKVNNGNEIIDPDSKSELLQKIYSRLWEQNVLSTCYGYRDDENKLQGDCIISINSTLNEYYSFFETEEEKGQRIKANTIEGTKKPYDISVLYLCCRYYESLIISNNDSSMKAMLLSNKMVDNNLINCLIKYHTIGNYMPIPLGCNAPRGIKNTKDYWDIALKIIYNYLFAKGDEIKNIVGEAKSDLYKKWINSFSIENNSPQDKWDNFIMKNYMQPFIKDFDGKKSKNFGEPKEFWDKHFNEYFHKRNPLPKTENECLLFFKTVNDIIVERGKLMVNELRKN